MSENPIYKRYMVFEWSEYDNAAPFHHCIDSFDNLDDAKELSQTCDDFGKCIFDRIDGLFVYSNEEY